MAFGSNDFPLGPNGQFPPQRIGNFDKRIAHPQMTIEEQYNNYNGARLPAVEEEYSSSVDKVKRRMKFGREMRKEQKADKFRPRYAPKLDMRNDEYEENMSAVPFSRFMSKIAGRGRVKQAFRGRPVRPQISESGHVAQRALTTRR